jgi:hypothetical protein
VIEYKGQSRLPAVRLVSSLAGCAGEDVLVDDGKVYVIDRVMFMRACLTQLQGATADAVPVKDYLPPAGGSF